MAENTKIEWCDHTFNPWIGCTKVSAGCAHCYAETQDKFRKWTPEGFGKGKPRTRTSAANWRQPLVWNERPWLNHPDPEVGFRRHRVFCASLADWLDDEVPVEWLADLLGLINDTPNLDWLLLTKRPENFTQRITSAWRLARSAMDMNLRWLRGDAPANVWIGTTVESQEMADKRIPELLRIPARVRFLSCEPLLGAVELEKVTLFRCGDNYDEVDALRGHAASCHIGFTGLRSEAGASREPRIHWVICGFESGPKARPGHPDWARGLRDQCRAAGVPLFFKQHGEYRHADDMTSWEYAAACKSAKYVRGPGNGYFRVGKKVAGRLLDGVAHSEFPKINIQ